MTWTPIRIASGATMTLDDLERLLVGFQSITFEEFCAVLRETVGADSEYCRGDWPHFLDSPMHYCCSRNPRSHGEALLKLALEKAPSALAAR